MAPNCAGGHCILHLLELEKKQHPPAAIKNILDEPVKNTKFIELQFSWTRLFTILCDEVGTTQEARGTPRRSVHHKNCRCDSLGCETNQLLCSWNAAVT